MVNYENSKIYKIVDNTNGNIYIGATSKKYLKQRLNEHKNSYKRYLGGKRKHTITSFEILKNGNFDIFLIEHYPCVSKDELSVRERYYIENTTCVNKVIPGRKIDMKEYMKEYMKTYNEINKEQLKENHRLYHIKNREYIIEKVRKHTEVNKEQVHERRTKIYECCCGASIQKAEKARHERSKKHVDFLNK